MTYQVLLTQEAEGQFLAAHNWWLENRPASPNLLVGEFEETVSLLEILPEAGHLFRRATIPGVRRVLLRKSNYWLYYVPDRPHSVVNEGPVVFGQTLVLSYARHKSVRVRRGMYRHRAYLHGAGPVHAS